MEPLISVIVPVYKVELFLPSCIESIISQTYQNIEIILVDDGSPDRCPQICDKWAAKDSRIKVIHKSNGGLSSARNAGLDAAIGDYIGFVDSDDTIDSHMYEKLLFGIQNNDADICICGIKNVDETGCVVKNKESVDIPTAVFTRETMFEMLSKWYYVTAPNKLYKKRIFDKNRFAEGRIHEDEFSVHHFIGECNRVATISEELYIYLQRSNSITTGSLNVRHLDAVDALLDRYEYFKKNKYKALARKTLREAYGVYISLIEKIEKQSNMQRLQETYKSIFYRLIKNIDLRAAKLFIVYTKYMTK